MTAARKSKHKKAARRPAARPPAVRRPTRPRAAEPAATRRAKQDAGSGVAPGMQAVSPYLAVANVQASMRFLEQTLAFTPALVLLDGGGQPRYAEMRKGEMVIMLVRKGDDTSPAGGAAALYTYVSDVDLALARARDAGAGCGVAEDTAWGDRAAVVTDPDGYRWVVATFKKLVPFADPPAE
jgi:uncharacterized glyoxalase superfamily protein PhnB